MSDNSAFSGIGEYVPVPSIYSIRRSDCRFLLHETVPVRMSRIG
jgi:hypothetical protein